MKQIITLIIFIIYHSFMKFANKPIYSLIILPMHIYGLLFYNMHNHINPLLIIINITKI